VSLGRVISVEPVAAPVGRCDPHVGCITCGDEALPMRVRRVDAERGLALCEDVDGRRSSVEIALVEPVAVGEALLVHAGTAIARASGVGGDDEPGAPPERGETG
jgi:hydrogenase maturation factor